MGKNKLNVVFIILFLLAVGGGYFLYDLICRAGDMWPAENEPGSLTAKIKTLETEVGRLRGEKMKIEPAREELKKVAVDYELASHVLPRESSPDHLIAAIRTKAEQSGVTPSSLTPSVVAQRAGGRGAAAGGGSFETWRFSLILTGSYDQIATFVNKMEEFDSPDAARTGSEKRFFEVREISITAQDSGMANLGPDAVFGPVRHQCTMVMQTYRYTGE